MLCSTSAAGLTCTIRSAFSKVAFLCYSHELLVQVGRRPQWEAGVLQSNPEQGKD